MHADASMRGPWWPAFNPMAAAEEGRGRRGRGRPGGGHGPRGGPGPFGFDPRMFGRGFGPRHRGRGRRARRGDVRAGILALLSEQARNGYQIIQELTERSNGYWRPSPGSVYPALQQLEDEGLVRTTEIDGRKAYELTDAGREYVEARPGEFTAPWDALAGDVDERAQELASLAGQLGGAVMQVVQAGNDAQLDRAKQILVDARRDLYRILADDEDASPDDADDETR
ncbi:MAG: PadR family transcriptional regulator [Streptosporangiales bacterium]|nr:PadR family transcriptional regulator [Streptosporangiales bacterium]